ncbi:MAG: DUF4242 domain-containing protein [Gemmatimonadota bacterium]
MRRYVIERDLEAVGSLSAEELNKTRKISNAALLETGPGIQWVESFITDNRIYCHYLAETPEQVQEHAKRAGLPANKVSEVRSVVNSLTVTPQSE